MSVVFHASRVIGSNSIRKVGLLAIHQLRGSHRWFSKAQTHKNRICAGVQSVSHRMNRSKASMPRANSRSAIGRFAPNRTISEPVWIFLARVVTAVDDAKLLKSPKFHRRFRTPDLSRKLGGRLRAFLTSTAPPRTSNRAPLSKSLSNADSRINFSGSSRILVASVQHGGFFEASTPASNGSLMGV